MKFVLVLIALSSQSFASGTINIRPQIVKKEVTETMESFRCKADESLADCLARFKAQPLKTK